MNRVSAWLRNRRLQHSKFNYHQLKQRLRARSQTPEEARAENGKAIRAIWQAVGDDIWKATKDYEDDLNAGD